MRYIWPFLLLCSFIAFAQSRPVRPAQSSSVSEVGRYQIFFNPNVRADTFLVDTETGKIWRMQSVTDVVGEPSVWVFEDRLDSKADMKAWASQQTFKPTASPAPVK